MSTRILRLSANCLALCLSLALTAIGCSHLGGDDKAAAERYLAEHEPQLQQSKDPFERRNMLMYLTPAALAADDVDKASLYAQDLLVQGELTKSFAGFGPGDFADATHVGNVVLGRIALKADNVEVAKERLLAAGNVTGSPVLHSFGPDMRLAKELVERGERKTVIEYLDLCAKFWEMDNGDLARWKKIIDEGGTPDFGSNLNNLDTWRVAWITDLLNHRQPTRQGSEPGK